MIQKFLSKYGLATHLAILAALPLALTPLLPEERLGAVVLWLVALAGMWLLVEPSVRLWERLSFARARVRRACRRDPVFWLLLVGVLYTFVRWRNTGIAPFFDAEKGAWSVQTPAWPALPASVEGTGFLPFAVSVAVLVVLTGLRHGVGRQARVAFGVVGAFVAGLGGLAAIGCAAAGGAAADWMASGFERAPFWASSFGVWLVVGVACGLQSETFKWAFARLPFVLGVTGCCGALVFFAPPLVALGWTVLAAALAVFSLCYLARALSGGAVARGLSLLVFGFALTAFAVMSAMPKDVRALKLRHLAPSCALEPHEADVAAQKVLGELSGLEVQARAEQVRAELTEKAARGREALNRIARRMWTAQPWTGAGLGAFPVQASFLAERAEWRDLPPRPAFTPNGLWNALGERGILGCALLALLLLLLGATYCARLVEAFRMLRREDERDVFAFAVAPLAWIAPFCVAGLVAEAFFSPLFLSAVFVLSLTVPLALSAAAFPRKKASPTRTGGAVKAGAASGSEN